MLKIRTFVKLFIVYVKLLYNYISFILQNLSKVHVQTYGEKNGKRCNFSQMNEKRPENMNKIETWENFLNSSKMEKSKILEIFFTQINLTYKKYLEPHYQVYT